MSEQNLYLQMKAGNQTAFDKLFHLHYEKLVRQAYLKTKNLVDAEDVVQTIFIDFWTKRNEINIEKSVIGYLSKMVYYRCMDYFRKQKSLDNQQAKYFENTLSLDIASPEEDLLNAENLAAIYKKIEALPPKCSIVFKMSRFEELTYDEIAEALGITKKTVEYHISTALRVLRKGIFSVVVYFLFISHLWLPIFPKSSKSFPSLVHERFDVHSPLPIAYHNPFRYAEYEQSSLGG